MVKPGGTGRPRLAISARLAPLPPSRSRRPALPSALPSPKVIDPLAGFYRLQPPACGPQPSWPRPWRPLAAGLAGAFFSALRADGAAARPWAGPMALISLQISLQSSWTSRRLWPWIPTIRKRENDCAPYTTLRGSAQAAKPRFPALELQHLEHAETDQTDEDQVDRDDEIQQPRHDQDQNPRNQGNDRRECAQR